MKLVLICDEEKIFEGRVSKVEIETENGGVTILPGHQPYMTKIIGRVSYTEPGSASKVVGIDEGFVYTDGEVCFVVVDKK